MVESLSRRETPKRWLKQCFGWLTIRRRAEGWDNRREITLCSILIESVKPKTLVDFFMRLLRSAKD